MAAAALVAVLVSYNNPAQAQSIAAVLGTTITVNTTEDELNADGDCSLREAIQAANPPNAPVDGCKAGSATERDAIHFALGRKATIELGSTLPAITDASGLNINGQKAKITISGNDAVRVFEVDSGAKLTLARLTVANGFIDGNGGGIENEGGTLKVTNSTFSGNSADFGGGIYNIGPLTVTDSTFSGNSAHDFSGAGGGGIYNAGGPLTVTNSTFSGNSTNLVGGGISNSDTLTVTNSTFSGNSANSGGGIHTSGTFATATLKNTIVANSPSGGNCSGGITDGGYNIDDGTTCGFSQANNSLPSTPPLLDPNGLQNNGGPTKTIKPLKGSPAINAIPEATNGCGIEITTDQRGVNRPQGSGCDIGAFEKKRPLSAEPTTTP